MVAINCDMGEGYGIYRCGDDEAIMPYVDMANVACGFHASDPSVMQRTVRLAKHHGVQVGAHPSYPDRQGFGRRAMVMDPDEITASIIYQAGALSGFLSAEGMRLGYIKAHGALYGQAAGDPDVAGAIAAAADALDAPLLGMADTVHEEVWGDRPQGFFAEYYSDLEYAPDGSLIITRHHAAVDPAEAAAGAVRAVSEKVAVAIDGSEIPMRADIVCVHSDTPGAVEVAAAVRSALAPYLS